MSSALTKPLDITAVAVFCGRTNAEAAAALMRQAVVALVAIPGIGFFNEEDRAIVDRPDGLAPEWTKKPVFLTDTASNYGIVVHHFWRADAPYHYLAISPDSEVQPAELDTEWKALTKRLEQAVDALKANLVIAFAQPPDAESDPVNYGELCIRPGTWVLTPWTFFSSDFLDGEIRKRLTAIPGVSTKWLKTGLSLTVATMPGRAPDPQFRKALEGSSDLQYIDPLLSNQ